MVGFKELISRVKDFLRFDKQELIGLIPAVIITAFIFSFRDWGGEAFSIITGIKNMILMMIIVSGSVLFRITCQKIYALSQGYQANFKVWWMGIVIALIVTFISGGRVPLVLIGTIASSFMVKQRLGEFRYGHSHFQAGIIALWGIFGNLLLTLLSAAGLFYFPQSYILSKVLIFNLVMASCSLIPLPWLEGLHIYFGSKNLYFLGLFMVLLSGILLLTKTKIGLIAAIIIGAVGGIIYLLRSSEV